MIQLCVDDPRIARKDFGGKRLLVLLHLHEDGVDLAEALLRGRARVLEDRILLRSGNTLYETDDQLALDRLRRLLRGGRDRSGADAEDNGGSQDEKRNEAGHLPKRIIRNARPSVYPQARQVLRD